MDTISFPCSLRCFFIVPAMPISSASASSSFLIFSATLAVAFLAALTSDLHESMFVPTALG